VKSESAEVHYIVRRDTGCTCPDAMQRNYICKHTWACYAAAAMTVWRIQLAVTALEIEWLLTIILHPLPVGIKRTIMMECDRAIERLLA
jgi:hypothetical protein